MTVYNSATGAETLAGTSGADVFAYNAVADSTTSASDTITFNRSQGDKIDFSALVPTGTGAPAALRFSGVDPAGGKAWSAWQWSTADGGNIRVDTNGDSSADMNINLSSPVALQSSDFTFAAAPPSGGTQNGTSGADTLTGTAGPDTLNGLGGADTLSGLAGDDVLSGAGGADTISGGDGNDTINGGTGIDQLTGGAGADVFVFAANDGGSVEPHDVITDFVIGTDKLSLPSGAEIVNTEADSSGTYIHYGDPNNSVNTDWILLQGIFSPNQAQLDQLVSPAGSQPPPPPPPTGGTSGNDTLTGTSGADSIDGLAGNDTISGLGGADNLLGKAGTDSINGGDGDDVINGGTGQDTLTGGNGADQFVFVSGDASNSEPHDIITDFVVGTDKLVLPGPILATEDTGTDTYVKYADNNNSWLRLNGLTDLSALDLVKLTDPSATEGSPPPNPGGGELPAHDEVVHYTFDNGFDGFTNRWGETQHEVINGDGAITVTSPGDQSSPGNGAMAQGEGFGYGLYEFDVQASPHEAPGPYALLWPQDNVWPGPELDVVERLDGGDPYATIHYDSQPGVDAYPDDNAYDSYFYPAGTSMADRHSYAMDWQQGYIDIYLDGQFVEHITDNVPNDAANGGVNSLPGVGELTDWAASYQDGQDNWITLYDFKYSVVA